MQANRRYNAIKAFDNSIEFDDLYNSGYIALISAVKDYPPDAEYKFLTHLGKCLLTAFAETTNYRSNRQKQDPMHSAKSLDAPLGGDSEGATISLLETIPSNKNDYEAVEAEIFNEQLHNVLENVMSERLDDRQRAIIKRRYYDSKTLEEIGVELGISLKIVRQEINVAFRELRRSAARSKLESFIEHKSNYYSRTSLHNFQSTGTSSVEALTMYRETLHERYA